jgi:cytoskeletal protein CcmA (bactofilin family)
MTVMIVITVIGMLVVAMVYSSSVRALRARQLGNKTRAIAIAEAGVAQTYSVLATNWGLRYNNSVFPPSNYGGGTYDVTVQVPAGNSNQAILVSTGFYSTVSASVMADLYNYGATNGGGGGGGGSGQGAYGYAIVSGGTMTWSGSGDVVLGPGAKIHSNDRFKMTGSGGVEGNISSTVKIWLTGSSHITGNAAAPVFDTSGSCITGSKTTGSVAAVAIPNIDLTPYYNAALASGQVYNGNQHFSSGNVAPSGGIMWVNGNLRISSSGQMIGCFIATGNIDITGSGDQIKVANYPAFVSRDGDVDLAGSGQTHGLIYVRIGDFDTSGSGNHIGSIIVGGTYDASGSGDFMTYENSTPVPPGGGGTTNGPTDQIGISAWYK